QRSVARRERTEDVRCLVVERDDFGFAGRTVLKIENRALLHAPLSLSAAHHERIRSRHRPQHGLESTLVEKLLLEVGGPERRCIVRLSVCCRWSKGYRQSSSRRNAEGRCTEQGLTSCHAVLSVHDVLPNWTTWCAVTAPFQGPPAASFCRNKP